MEQQLLERSAVVFTAMGNQTRLRIIELLTHNAASVNEIAHSLNLSQSGASQHLSILARAGLVTVHPQGAVRLYKMRGPRISKILTIIQDFIDIHQLHGEEEIIIDDVEQAKDLTNI